MTVKCQTPSAWAIAFASNILRSAEDLGIPPTNRRALSAGGIGLSWNTPSHYADVEVNNNQEVVFTLSRDRKDLQLMTITNDSNGIKTGLDRVRRTLAKGDM
jgi:3-hydroxyisobutyrate dehydrogenase-like beta-hydroxyacid dehydrogenase